MKTEQPNDFAGCVIALASIALTLLFVLLSGCAPGWTP